MPKIKVQLAKAETWLVESIDFIQKNEMPMELLLHIGDFQDELRPKVERYRNSLNKLLVSYQLKDDSGKGLTHSNGSPQIDPAKLENFAKEFKKLNVDITLNTPVFPRELLLNLEGNIQGSFFLRCPQFIESRALIATEIKNLEKRTITKK